MLSFPIVILLMTLLFTVLITSIDIERNFLNIVKNTFISFIVSLVLFVTVGMLLYAFTLITK